MVPHLRAAFNAAFTDARYRAYLEALDAAVGAHVAFRVSETPVFLSAAFEAKLFAAAEDILAQLLTPEYRAESERAFPPGAKAPNESDHPEFVLIDFAVVAGEDGTPDLRLIELQGFPSLYGFQELLARTAIASYGFSGLRHLARGLDPDSYAALLRRTVLGGHDPRHVVLLEVDPRGQKTRPDFLVTERHTGIRTVDITAVEVEGRALFYRDDDRRRVRIERVYNRAILDEIERRNVPVPFRFSDDLDVEWACHPNWFYRISKFSLPFLRHPTVPETRFLSSFDGAPADLAHYVLKPLYSFAGGGVVLSPTPEDLRAIPESERDRWLLQRKVAYAPVLATPEGGAKVELRVMFLWDDRPVPALLLVRTGRAEMMGVGFNRDLAWVGATCALIEDP